MGLLDDAIREHLELKRRHGAPDSELARQEAEALGPARRSPAEDLTGDEPSAEDASAGAPGDGGLAANGVGAGRPPAPERPGESPIASSAQPEPEHLDREGPTPGIPADTSSDPSDPAPVARPALDTSGQRPAVGPGGSLPPGAVAPPDASPSTAFDPAPIPEPEPEPEHEPPPAADEGVPLGDPPAGAEPSPAGGEPAVPADGPGAASPAAGDFGPAEAFESADEVARAREVEPAIDRAAEPERGAHVEPADQLQPADELRPSDEFQPADEPAPVDEPDPVVEWPASEQGLEPAGEPPPPAAAAYPEPVDEPLPGVGQHEYPPGPAAEPEPTQLYDVPASTPDPVTPEPEADEPLLGDELPPADEYVPGAGLPGDPPDGQPEDADPGADVLEETPEFLQETPEHDRLWFEQRPPRDFDFDD